MELPNAVLQMVLAQVQLPFWNHMMHHASDIEDKLTKITPTPEDTNTSIDIIEKVIAQEGDYVFTRALFAAPPNLAKHSVQHSNTTFSNFSGCQVRQLKSVVRMVKDMKLPLEI